MRKYEMVGGPKDGEKTVLRDGRRKKYYQAFDATHVHSYTVDGDDMRYDGLVNKAGTFDVLPLRVGDGS